MKWRTIGLSLGLFLVMSVPSLAANYVVNVGPPLGVDDTAMLQSALDYCASHGPGCIMQLTAGKFVTKQLFTENFRGTIKGMGMDKTTIEAYAPLPVTQKIPWWSDVPTLWPELIQFKDGDISISDLAIRFTAPVATTEWSYDELGDVPVHELLVVLRVTGESANLSLNRVKMEGGFADGDTGIWGRLNAQYVVVAEPWDFPLVGTLSITGSVFLNINVAVAAYALDSAKVTIGGSPQAGNLFEDVEQPVYLLYLQNSASEISYNKIIRTNWSGMMLDQSCCGPFQTSSKFVVEHNDITVVPTYAIDSGWWPDAIDIFDRYYPPDDPHPVKSQFLVSHNTIQLAPKTGGGVFALQDSGSIVSNNQISGSGFYAVGLSYENTYDLLLGNNVQHFISEETPFGTFAPIFLDATTSNCAVVGGHNATNVMDLGTDNTLVGVNNMQGNPPGPAIRDALRRKMEIIKSMRKP